MATKTEQTVAEGLRALADWYDAHPEVDTPSVFLHFFERGGEAASHFLGVPMVPPRTPKNSSLLPLLIVDTATESGQTLRKTSRKCGGADAVAIFHEPPRVKFWYEFVAESERAA